SLYTQLKCPITKERWLPSEIWSQVFGYLSAEDKYSVRASSKYFKKLADHRSLWKDWSVVLGLRESSYNRGFWASLRRREVASVVLRGSQAEDWERAAVLLPSLTTVVVEHSSHASLGSVAQVPNLKRLAFRSSRIYLMPDAAPAARPQQLTQLSMCDVTFPSAGLDGFISALTQFTNLTSLACHHLGILEDTMWMVHSILNCLPKLKHLSLAVMQTPRPLQRVTRPNPRPSGGAAVLSSLEIIDCIGDSLPEDLMRRPSTNSHHLKTWLRRLPQLSTLVVAKGPPVKKYVASIPATVTRLTLCVTGLSSEDMADVARQVPDLLHLHIDPWPSHLGGRTAEIPRLFPQLKRLKLRREHVPERDFLQLHKLQDLKYLEILDNRPFLSDIADKLRELTRHSLQVVTSPRRRDVWLCPCVSQVY
uniref:F-box domain-containing protein n=1 Tax=Cyclopterus lumpus TaxID=8103 RepID=A0A8C3A3R4_CYCLU